MTECKCNKREQYDFDDRGATFECESCQMLHRMCCAVWELDRDKQFLCGKVDGHPGNHSSIYLGKEWDNSVYKLPKMGP